VFVSIFLLQVVVVVVVVVVVTIAVLYIPGYRLICSNLG
jgi:hypothetical protein